MKAAVTSALASSTLILVLGGFRAAQGPGIQPTPHEDPEQQRKILAPIMAKKLRHTQQLIAALAVEDFARLASDARELKLIGEATLSKVSPNLDYVRAPHSCIAYAARSPNHPAISSGVTSCRAEPNAA